MDGKIVYQGKTKSGQDISIRYPILTDVKQLTSYINTLSSEKTFIRFQGEQQTVEQEEIWLKTILDKVNSHQGVSLYAVVDNQIVGVCDINMRDQIESHIGLFGLTVAKAFRGEGIGKLLMHITIDEAIKQLPQMKIIDLSVFASNPIAIHLYESFGFKQYGVLPHGISHNGEYVNHIYMFKEIR